MGVLNSFRHRLGADRICYTAWRQVLGLVEAGVDVLLYPGFVFLGFFLNLGIAAASFHWIEAPIMRLKGRFQYT